MADDAALYERGIADRRDFAGRAECATACSAGWRAAAGRSGGFEDPLAPLDWVTVYAMAVNEENAAGRPRGDSSDEWSGGGDSGGCALLHAVCDGEAAENQEGIIRFFLTSAAIGILYKENASISGAEVGCQGEVGVACSMAAGGLIAALGGTNDRWSMRRRLRWSTTWG